MSEREREQKCERERDIELFQIFHFTSFSLFKASTKNVTIVHLGWDFEKLKRKPNYFIIILPSPLPPLISFLITRNPWNMMKKLWPLFDFAPVIFIANYFRWAIQDLKCDYFCVCFLESKRYFTFDQKLH